jgi:hypothetical protein
MKQALRRHTLDSHPWTVLVLAAALTSIACGGDINVTAPKFPTFTSQGEGFQVAGTLTAVDGEIVPDLDTADIIALGPARASLEAGESVIFEFAHLR